MNLNERRYRKTVGSIGVSMLLFSLLINAFSIGIVFLVFVIEALPFSDVGSAVFFQLFYAAGYLLSFMLPVALFKLLIKNAAYPYLSMRAEMRMSPWILLLIPAGISMVHIASYVNMGMISIFGYSDLTSEMINGMMGEQTPIYMWVLQFIVICAVPGFCEEFLFRGAILTNLLPYGRTVAIFAGSLLFSMMHQNPQQIFYTFVAGIVFGLIYERTGNIWASTLMHILNNFAALFQSMILERYGYASPGMGWSIVPEAVLFLLGAVSAMILVLRFGSKRPEYKDGIFEISMPMSDSYASCPVESKRACKLFLTPSMIVFFAICILQIISLLGVAVLYGILF